LPKQEAFHLAAPASWFIVVSHGQSFLPQWPGDGFREAAMAPTLWERVWKPS
jgi:hypothetical protein